MSETLGRQLASARAKKGVSVEEIARLTRINAKFIRMLEEDRYDLLPGLVFIKGLLRTYSGVLGLSAEEMVAKFEGLGVEIADRSPKLISMPLNPKTGMGKKIAAGVAALAVVAWLFYYFLSPSAEAPDKTIEQQIKNREIKTPTVVITPQEAKPAETAALETTNAPAAAPAAPAPVTEKKDAAPVTPLVAKPAAPAPVANTVAAKPAAPAPALAKREATPAPVAPATVKPAAPAQGVTHNNTDQPADGNDSQNHKLIITASEETWVSVSMDSAGSKQMTLQPGQSVSFKAKKRFKLTVGNVSGTKARLDGEDVRFHHVLQNVVTDMEIPVKPRPAE
ncbi:MAG: DUF4115 domain-containing protein [Nitrospinae bacterium]|nr:DUF4115 domain-containing protein [Nitrospinota bacterium]